MCYKIAKQKRRALWRGKAARAMDRCDRAAFQDAAEEHLVGRGHLDGFARLDDLNSLALSRHDAGHLFEFPEAEALAGLLPPAGTAASFAARQAFQLERRKRPFLWGRWERLRMTARLNTAFATLSYWCEYERRAKKGNCGLSSPE
jgi:hypothetical protein